MKTIILAAAAAALVASGAVAQTTHSTTTTTGHATASDHNPAIKDSDTAHTAMPAKGRNSFTEDQARSRLTKDGYTNVTKLAKDDNGVWRGTATKGGTSVQVGLDYKGNVTTK